ncbi:MAG: diguanylate cyclase [Magnetococcales bacterium]|nr:diguanylate cyclase [Magnetococcales bacterium]
MRKLSHRILFLLGTTMLSGFLGLTLFLTHHEKQTALAQGERLLLLLSETIIEGLQTVMLSGVAESTREYIHNLEQLSDIRGVTILRNNGQEAFRDNSTIADVNHRIGVDSFTKRKLEAPAVTVIHPDDPMLKRLVSVDGAAEVQYSYDADDYHLLTIYMPIRNRDSCHGCHGDDQSVRGLVKISTSMFRVEHELRKTGYSVWTAVMAVMLFILVMMYLLTVYSVVQPIERMKRAMKHVVSRENDCIIPQGDSCEEFDSMAASFNHMVTELNRYHRGLQSERQKLETIIYSAREGIVVTDQQGDVVLVNPAAEVLLGKTEARICEEDFSNLIDDPDYINASLANGRVDGSVPETVFYNDKLLNIYTAMIRTPDGSPLGAAALIRDVTEEKNLERQLRRFSNTDALTGLNNRRRFDELLLEEFDRACRYKLDMALILFDVDHFKRFNDEHGHDQGDRVLQAIGQKMNEIFRTIDAPCRYGGEEFVVILPNTSRDGAVMVAERFRQAVAEMVVDGLRVTVSIGVAVRPWMQYADGTAMVKSADDALYRAKKDGRNCVRLAEPSA